VIPGIMISIDTLWDLEFAECVAQRGGETGEA